MNAGETCCVRGVQGDIGGVNTCRYAAENHVSFMMIQTSQEAFWNALSDVKRTWSIFRKEQEKALRLQALLDISHDGILLIDPDFKLTAMNRKAQSVLGIDGEHLPVDALSLGGELKDVLAGDEEYVNRLVQYGSNMLNVSKNVLKIQSSICGYVVNVQAVKEIQSMEHDIRKRICKRGHIARYRFDDITGESPVMISTVETARRYSRTSSNILLIGQSGTGKEMFAQSIHNDSSAGGCPLWLLIVLLFRNSFWKASCSVMYRGLLQERTGTERRDFLSWPTKEPFFWTKSERFHCRCRRNYCGFFRRGRLMRVGEILSFPWISASWRLPTRIWSSWRLSVSFGRIYCTAGCAADQYSLSEPAQGGYFSACGFLYETRVS